MSTYDARLSALEKNVNVMTQDIIYKFDGTNSALTLLQGVVSAQGRDLKQVVTQLESLDSRVEGIDARLARSEVQLAGLTQDVKAIQEQQNVQGQDIRDIKHRLDGFDQRFASVDQRFDRIDQRFDGIDQRFDGIDQRFVSLEEKFDQRFVSLEEKFDQRFVSLEEKADQRFEKVIQAIVALTNKIEKGL